MRTRKAERTMRTRPWLRIEYIISALSLVVLLGMLVGTAADLSAVHARQLKESTAVRNEEDNYLTIIYNGFGQKRNEQKDAQDSGALTLEYDENLVDLSQFAEDEGYAGALYAMREEYPKAAEILLRYENTALTVEGEATTVGQLMENAIQERLLQMAADYPQTMDFVLRYPTEIDKNHVVDTSSISTKEVPLFIQWDKQWGYRYYGDGLLGYTGCGPTCLSMVLVRMTGDTSLTPDVVASYADGNGYYERGIGSSWTLMWEGAAHYGLKAIGINVDETGMRSAVEKSPLICAMGPGDFTRSGHFIVITGYENGAFTVNDPNSPENSQRSWTFDELSGQIRSCWYYLGSE